MRGGTVVEFHLLETNSFNPPPFLCTLLAPPPPPLAGRCESSIHTRGEGGREGRKGLRCRFGVYIHRRQKGKWKKELFFVPPCGFAPLHTWVLEKRKTITHVWKIEEIFPCISWHTRWPKPSSHMQCLKHRSFSSLRNKFFFQFRVVGVIRSST